MPSFEICICLFLFCNMWFQGEIGCDSPRTINWWPAGHNGPSKASHLTHRMVLMKVFTNWVSAVKNHGKLLYQVTANVAASH